MTPQNLTDTAAHLAGKDDRYLAIIAVLMLIAGGALIIRYLANFLERLTAKQEVQTEKLSDVVSKNTSMFERCNDSLRRCDATLTLNVNALDRATEALNERKNHP